jgi:hypothetical protein
VCHNCDTKPVFVAKTDLVDSTSLLILRNLLKALDCSKIPAYRLARHLLDVFDGFSWSNRCLSNSSSQFTFLSPRPCCYAVSASIRVQATCLLSLVPCQGREQQRASLHIFLTVLCPSWVALYTNTLAEGCSEIKLTNRVLLAILASGRDYTAMATNARPGCGCWACERSAKRGSLDAGPVTECG